MTSDPERPSPALTPAQERLRNLWEEHVGYEFATRDTEDTLATMVEDAYVNHIPVLTGGVGRDALRAFYSRRFIPEMPPDTEMVPVSRTIGDDQIVDEMVFRFTHTIRMDWMLPGLAPTGGRPRERRQDPRSPAAVERADRAGGPGARATAPGQMSARPAARYGML